MDYNSGKSLQSLIKSITELLMKLFKKSYNNEQGLFTLEEYKDNVERYLDNHVQSQSPFGQWANDNMKDFLDKAVNFAKENDAKMIELFNAGKHGEAYDIIMEGVARDIGLEMSSQEIPDNISTDPNRRLPEHIGKAMSGLDGVGEELEDSTIGQISELVSKNVSEKMSQPVLSKFEKDNDLSFDDKPENERIKNHGFNTEGENNELDSLDYS